jgi:hypothetical protein
MVAYCSAFILKAKPPAVGFLSMGNKKRKRIPTRHQHNLFNGNNPLLPRHSSCITQTKKVS